MIVGDDCGDDTFGPGVASKDCRYGLDFTLLFQECFLVITPCAIFVASAIVQIALLSSYPVRFHWTRRLSFKLMLASLLSIVRIVELILWTLEPRRQTETALAATSLELISALAICILLLLEHARSIRVSTLLSIFLALTLLFDIVRVRSFSMMVQMSTALVTIAVSMGLKMLLLVAEHLREVLQDGKKKPSEQETGILPESLILWLLPVFRLGYRNSIDLKDLPPLLQSMHTSTVASNASKLWSKSGQDRTHALAMMTFWLARRTLLQQMVPRLCLVGFSVAQPFLIERFIENITYSSDSSAFLFIGAFALVYVGIAISTMWYQLLTVRTITTMRGSLLSLIYAKTLQLPVADLNDLSAVSLITADVERISTAIEYIQNFWADIIQIGLATYILSRYISAVCVSAIVVALISSTVAGQLSKMIGPRQRVWFDKGRERIKHTIKTLDEIKSIKWSGLEGQVKTNISELRSDQISAHKHFRLVQNMMIFLGNFPGIATPFVVFLSFAITSRVSTGPPLPLAQVFAVLSILSLLIGPVGEIIGILPNFGASLNCFSSIQDYLLKSGPFYSENQLTTNGKNATNVCEDPQIYARFTNVSITVQGSDAARIILRDMTFIIPTGRLTLITGPTGCGKSTLLQSFFKGAVSTSGELFTRYGTIGLCGQSPWIMNGSIRENIIGPCLFDESWYSSVLAACCLLSELHRFPQGDETIIGSKGGSLSGGQTARVALARAVYSRAPTVMLDEPFSSLDSNTEEKCFRQLLGSSGLLSTGSTTVILVSVRMTWLNYADNVITLNNKGGLVVSGCDRDASVQDLPGSDIVEATEQHTYPPSKEKVDAVDTLISSRLISNRNGTGSSPQSPMKDTRLVPYYLHTMSFWLFAMLLLMMVAQVTLIAVQPLWLNYWIEYNISKPNQHTGYYFGIYAIFVVMSLGLLYGCASMFFLVLVPSSSQRLHDRLLSTTLDAPLSFFQYTKPGTILNHFSQDLMLVDMSLPLSLLLASENGMASFTQLILISISTGYVALAIPGILLALWLVQHVYLRTSKQIRLLDLAAKAPIYDHITETISGMSTIKSLSWQDYFISKNHAIVDTSQSPYYLLLCMQKWLALVLNLIVAGLAVVLTATAIALRNHVNPGLIGVSLISMIGLGEKLSYFITFWTSLETSLGAVSRIKTYVDQTPKHDSIGQPDVGNGWPQSGNIEIADLSAGYAGQTVLHGITCTIPQGQKVLLYGPSGSGKTSFVATLLRLIDIKGGRVAIDGKDITTMSSTSLQRAIFALPQTLTFVSRTIRSNLTSRIRHSVTDLELERVLVSVSLWSRVCSLPDGLETLWSSDVFSHGQKQLFAFAQVMLSHCPIIVIDEISSYLDDETVSIIQRLLSSEFSNRTVLMISHDTRQGFKHDRSIRLDGGRIVLDEGV